MDYHKSVVDKASALLSEINPIYKDKLEANNRLSKLETTIDELKSLVSNLVTINSK